MSKQYIIWRFLVESGPRLWFSDRRVTFREVLVVRQSFVRVAICSVAAIGLNVVVATIAFSELRIVSPKGAHLDERARNIAAEIAEKSIHVVDIDQCAEVVKKRAAWH